MCVRARAACLRVCLCVCGSCAYPGLCLSLVGGGGGLPPPPVTSRDRVDGHICDWSSLRGSDAMALRWARGGGALELGRLWTVIVMLCGFVAPERSRLLLRLYVAC